MVSKMYLSNLNEYTLVSKGEFLQQGLGNGLFAQVLLPELCVVKIQPFRGGQNSGIKYIKVKGLSDVIYTNGGVSLIAEKITYTNQKDFIKHAPARYKSIIKQGA